MDPKRNYQYLWLLLFLMLGICACSGDNPTDSGGQSQGLALFPADGAILTSDFLVSIGTDAIDSIAVFLDDTLLAVVSEPPFTLPVLLVKNDPGEHSLAVTVYDAGTQEQLSAEILLCFGLGLDVGNYAPSYSLKDLGGVSYSFPDPQGAKVVLLDFWATWCPPCIQSLPETQRLFEEYGDRGLKVLTVTSDMEELVRPFVHENNYTFPVLLDENAMAHKIYGICAIPTYFLIDSRGVIRYVYVGTGGRPLEEIILELL